MTIFSRADDGPLATAIVKLNLLVPLAIAKLQINLLLKPAGPLWTCAPLDDQVHSSGGGNWLSRHGPPRLFLGGHKV